MKAMRPGSDSSRKSAGLFHVRRELLLRGGAFAIVSFLAPPLKILALPQTPADSPAKPEKKLLTVEERVERIIAEQVGVDAKLVVPDAKLRDDLGADSLDLIEITMAVEEAFELPNSVEACEKWETVAEVVHFAQAEIAKKQPAPAPH